MADELLGYWLNAETKEPSRNAYAHCATIAHKVVLSKVEEQLPRESSQVIPVTTDQEMERAVSALKRQLGKNIVVRRLRHICAMGLGSRSDCPRAV